MQKNYWVLYLLFFAFPTLAQKANKSLNISITPSHLLVKDEILSPMIYRGSGLALQLAYQRVKTKGTWAVGGTYMKANDLNSKNATSTPIFGKDKMIFFLAEIFWEYLHHLKKTEKWEWKLGLNNTNTFVYRNWVYGDIKNDNFIIIGIYNELKINHYLAYHFSNNLIFSNYTAFNLINYSFYNPNNVRTIESRFIFPNQFFDLQNVLLFTWKAGKNFNLSAGYQFRWLRQNQALTQWNFATAQQGFMLQTSFIW